MSDNNNQKTVQETQKVTEDIKNELQEQLSYILDAGKASKERLEYLAKQNEYTVAFDDGTTKTFKRKPLSAKRNKEIESLRSAFSSSKNYEDEYEREGKKFTVNDQEFNTRVDILFSAYQKTAEYCLGISEKDYDSLIWEDDESLEKKGVYGIKSIVEACMMRTVHGIAYFHQPSKTS